MDEKSGNKMDTMFDTIAKYYVKAAFIAAAVLFIYNAGFGSMSDMSKRCWLVTLVCPPIFFLKPMGIGKEGRRNRWTKGFDLFLCLLLNVCTIYMIFAWPAKLLKSTPYTTADYVLGIMMIAVVLEATRRAAGSIVMLTSFIFLLYTRFGYLLPGILGHRGESWKRIITTLYVSTEGFFGSTVGVAANYIILFVVFGAFLEAFGTGQWFVDFAYAITGKFRGGPAKTAVVSSGLMGMLSGASAANVVTTGSFTIPLMKKMGYEPHEAGAIEAVASTGGMLMPPIMGSGAFIMAEYLQVKYSVIAAAAAIPAILFYVSLILMTDAVAVKRGLVGLPKEELPKFKEVIKDRGFLAIPIFVLVAMIGIGFSASKSAVIAIGSILAVACLKRETRPTLKKILTALENGAKGSSSIVMITSCVGMIVCALTLTGLGTRLSNALFSLAGGNLYMGALLAAFIAIILGCGMPVAAVYIILGSILAPSLIQMGAAKLAAHMFIFYFACIGTITPPVAITAYTGAAIAEANPNKTGFTAFRYGAVAYIIPFMFIISPELLLIGTTKDIILSVLTALLGVLCLTAALEGYMVYKFYPLPRIFMGIAACLLLLSGVITDLAGFLCIAAAFITDIIIAKSKGSSIGTQADARKRKKNKG